MGKWKELAEPPCKTGSQCTNKCQRCGEVNPAEIHTCTPQVCCQEYETCTRPCTPRGREQTKREWQGLTDEEREEATGWSVEHIEAKLKEKNNDKR